MFIFETFTFKILIIYSLKLILLLYKTICNVYLTLKLSNDIVMCKVNITEVSINEK